MLGPEIEISVFLGRLLRGGTYFGSEQTKN